MPAALLWAYSAENDFKLSDTGQPAGCPVSHFHQRGRKGKRHLQRLFPAETAALWMGCPLDVTSPFVKKQFRNARRRFGTAIQNILSALDAQSATTTTAASGGNREELLGQRPARRACRPRHEADAGCRNPIAAGIPNRFTCPPAAPPARLSGRADGSLPRQRSRPRAARTGQWRFPRPGGRADSAAPARWALRFPADGR